jgi:protein TonB
LIALSPEDLVDLRRWLISGAVVVLAYGAIGAAIVTWHEPVAPDEPAAAIVIEFAPVVAAPAKQTELPPGPEMTASDASLSRPTDSLEEKTEEKIEQVEAKLEQKVEEKLEAKPVEEPPPEVKPAPDPEVAIQPPPPPQEVKQEIPMRQDPRAPAPATSAPQAVPEQTAAIPTAPTQGQIKPRNSQAAAKWQNQIVAAIERNKRFPETAARRGESGTAQVFFSIDRHGRVLSSRIVRSSGAAVLDDEALALLHRAEPFPPPPPEYPGDSVNFILPLHFAK